MKRCSFCLFSADWNKGVTPRKTSPCRRSSMRTWWGHKHGEHINEKINRFNMNFSHTAGSKCAQDAFLQGAGGLVVSMCAFVLSSNLP